jgi:hypothetical protein
LDSAETAYLEALIEASQRARVLSLLSAAAAAKAAAASLTASHHETTSFHALRGDL